MERPYEFLQTNHVRNPDHPSSLSFEEYMSSSNTFFTTIVYFLFSLRPDPYQPAPEGSKNKLQNKLHNCPKTGPNNDRSIYVWVRMCGKCVRHGEWKTCPCRESQSLSFSVSLSLTYLLTYSLPTLKQLRESSPCTSPRFS